MVTQGPADLGDQKWMRRTVAFSVGYFANDLLLILVHWPVVAGSDMIAHHLIIGGFFVLGLLDRSHHKTFPTRLMLVNTRMHISASVC